MSNLGRFSDLERLYETTQLALSDHRQVFAVRFDLRFPDEHWRFTLPEDERTVTVSGNRISDDADTVRRWAVACEGLIYKSRLDLVPDLLSGRLVEVFLPMHCEPSPLHLLWVQWSRLTPVITQLRKFLRGHCEALQENCPLVIALAKSSVHR